jgi:hypothetical protein
VELTRCRGIRVCGMDEKWSCSGCASTFEVPPPQNPRSRCRLLQNLRSRCRLLQNPRSRRRLLQNPRPLAAAEHEVRLLSRAPPPFHFHSWRAEDSFCRVCVWEKGKARNECWRWLWRWIPHVCWPWRIRVDEMELGLMG